MVDSSQTLSEWVDPRVRRTRQMLFDALESILHEKSIEDISVADITNRACLNRGTFYDHYSDKRALLEGWVESRFQELLSQRKIQFDGSCAYALMGITLATCDYLADAPQAGCPNRRQMEKHVESAIVSVVRRMILSGLSRHPPGADRLELIAASVTGAICGAAREWANSSDRPPAEEVANLIFRLFGPIMTSPQPVSPMPVPLNYPDELRKMGDDGEAIYSPH